MQKLHTDLSVTDGRIEQYCIAPRGHQEDRNVTRSLFFSLFLYFFVFSSFIISLF